jgi:hypothetical protein
VLAGRLSSSSVCFITENRWIVRKKKPVDPVRQAEKNRAHRIGWLIALAGIVVGFVLVMMKPA